MSSGGSVHTDTSTVLEESPGEKWTTEQTVMASVGITAPEIERRKRLVGIGPEDHERIAQVRDIVVRHADELTDAFFAHLGREDARIELHAQLVAQARPLKREHLAAMVQGRYDLAYAQQRIRLALVYGRFEVETSVFLGAYHNLLASIQRTILLETALSPPIALEAFLSLRRVAFFDLSLQNDVLIHQRERLIHLQAQAMRELSAPVLQIRDRLLLMPMIGVIDSQRARMMTDKLWAAIRRSRALVVVLDVTGVAAIDEVVGESL